MPELHIIAVLKPGVTGGDAANLTAVIEQEHTELIQHIEVHTVYLDDDEFLDSLED